MTATAESTCPACGAAMFGWATASRRPAYAPGPETVGLIERCEACGLGLPSGEGAALEGLDAAGRVEGPNRASLQAAIGAGGWAAIGRERRAYPTPAAAEPIASRLGGRAVRIRTGPNRAGLWGMWQTLVNAFTLGDNVITDALAGRQSPASTRERFALGLDLLVSALVAVPMLAIAVVLETAAALTGRGGVVRFEIER